MLSKNDGDHLLVLRLAQKENLRFTLFTQEQYEQPQITDKSSL